MILKAESSPSYRIVLSSPVETGIDRFSWRSKVVMQTSVQRQFGTKSWILWTGCFDGDDLHRGHRSLLQALSGIAPVVVGVESDETLWWNKGMFRPHIPQAMRVERLAKLPEVSMVIPFSEVVFYNPMYDVQKSAHAYESRMTSLRPSMVPIFVDDPTNPYPRSLNAYAKRIGATRLVYDLFSNESTSRQLGY